MPFQEHESAQPLPPEDTVIWRFMSLAKFISLISRRALYFAQITSFRNEDPFEGTYSRPNRDFYDRLATDDDALRRFLSLPAADPVSPALKMAFSVEFNKQRNELSAYWAYANCWHISPVESAFLWKVYAAVGDGVAVRTTIARLKEALLASDRPIYIGAVKYIDFDIEPIREGNLLNPIFRKRVSFQHEQELRCVTTWDGEFEFISSGPDTGKIDLAGFPNGIEIRADLPALVEEVRVAPSAPEWFERVVAESCSAFELAVPVSRSAIGGKAIF